MPENTRLANETESIGSKRQNCGEISDDIRCLQRGYSCPDPLAAHATNTSYINKSYCDYVHQHNA